MGVHACCTSRWRGSVHLRAITAHRLFQLSLPPPNPLPSSPAARCLPDVSHFLPGSVQCVCMFILDSPLNNNHFKKSFS